MEYWETIAGWSWGYISAIDSNGRTIFVADAHRDDGKRFIVHADEELTAFLELESANSGISQFHAPMHCQATQRRHRNVRLNARRLFVSPRSRLFEIARLPR
jgi:hypothetical protein